MIQTINRGCRKLVSVVSRIPDRWSLVRQMRCKIPVNLAIRQLRNRMKAIRQIHVRITFLIIIIIIYFQFSKLYCRQSKKLVTMVPVKVKSHLTYYIALSFHIFRNCHLLLIYFLDLIFLCIILLFSEINF